MSKICYKEKNFKPSSIKMIEQANQIIREYRAAGYSLTLRQLYYQFVSRDLIPNQQSEYKKLGSVINDARLAGLISWDVIEDRTRNLETVSTWESPAEILRSSASCFKLDLWNEQENYVEVWVEKEALVGVIEPICEELRVPFFACRGYSSQSEQQEAGRRLARKIDQGKSAIILHLGDHDPSGIDMTRDNDERLRMFVDYHSDASMFTVDRIALNMDQIKKHKPPPNPAKNTDTRFDDYARMYGDKSWELDALPPQIIANLIRERVEDLIDWDSWNSELAREERCIDKLNDLAESDFD